MNLALITLGCVKNQVDSEMILGLFKQKGFNIITDLNLADIIVVNTCGFIKSAKVEAINTILEMADYKKSGNCKYLIVTGCLAKRYKDEILTSMPEVDLCIGVDEYDKFDQIVSNALNLKCLNLKLNFNSRIISSTFPLSYIRISDGCDNRCTYCAIPYIRGGMKSRKMEDILEEVKSLASQKMSEFCIIAQDTTKYGLDIYGKPMLAELLNKISKIDGVKWIRILYMYTHEVSTDVFNEIKNNDKICKYFDIPIQHISNRMLKLMNRHDTKQEIYDLVKKIRENIPNAIIRTTVMTGFPGETEDDFNQLVDAVSDLKFDRLGAFAYSKEENTPAYSMKNQIKESIKKERLNKILAIQQKISLENNRKLVDRVYEVIVEDVSDDENYFVCRSYMNAPDVDGKIYIKIDDISAKKVIVGSYVNVKITDYNEYDLFAQVI